MGRNRNGMAAEIRLDGVYGISGDVVARDIEGEFIIVPLTSGIGDLEDALYSLNATGRAVWDRLDGKRPLSEVVDALCEEYQADAAEIRRHVLGLMTELSGRGMVVEVSRGEADGRPTP